MRQVQTSNGRIVLSNEQRSLIDAIDTTLEQAHGLFQREYRRQLEMYKAHYGCYPYYHYEYASVAKKAREALPSAVRAVLGWV